MARPREFEEDKVLQKMMGLFWEKGFIGTSMQDLVKTSGLQKGSLYGLGNKQKIFEMALDYYLNRGPFSVRKESSPLAALVDYYSRAIAEADLPPSKRHGCFIFNSCLEFGNKSSSVSDFVLKLCRTRLLVFQNLVIEAQNAGEVSKKIDAKKMGQRLFAAAFTIREMSKFMPDKEFLSEIANGALELLGASAKVKV